MPGLAYTNMAARETASVREEGDWGYFHALCTYSLDDQLASNGPVQQCTFPVPQGPHKSSRNIGVSETMNQGTPEHLESSWHQFGARVLGRQNMEVPDLEKGVFVALQGHAFSYSLVYL